MGAEATAGAGGAAGGATDSGAPPHREAPPTATAQAVPPAKDPAFPVRIHRRLTVALGVVILGVLVVGGISVALAVRIVRNHESVAREHSQLRRLGQVRSTFDDLVFGVMLMSTSGRLADMSELQFLYEDLTRISADLMNEDEVRSPAASIERQRALRELDSLARQALELGRRMSARERLSAPDVTWLHHATHQIPRRLDDLAGAHRSRITELQAETEGFMRGIVVLYGVFFVIGGALVAGASSALDRSLSSPLQQLAGAARALAQGQLHVRVRAASRDDIGQLCHDFNAMADRLQANDRELRKAHKATQRRAREAESLYRIATEISRLQRIDGILVAAAEGARELLGADAAALCLANPQGGALVVRAATGSPELYHVGELVGSREPLAPCPGAAPAAGACELVAALELADERIGEIRVASQAPRTFGPEDARLLGSIAVRASIAIERTRLAEERQRMATLEERERIAREIHDGFAQALGLLHLKLHGALTRGEIPAAVSASLRDMLAIAQDAYEDVRQSIFGLRTNVSAGAGLVPTLSEYLRQFGTHAGIPVELEVAEGMLLPPSSEVQAIRIIQEALANVRKHASAQRARVRLQREGVWVRVEIEDDGVGWNLTARNPAGARHFGLQTMRERAEGLGGRLEILTAPGHGTRVVASLPGELT